MDDARVGNLLRAVRRRRGWRQADVARAAGLPQTSVSRAERGQLERLTLSTTRRIAAALEVALQFDPRWRGGETARLLDELHANLVERCATILRRAGWEVIIEFTFSVYGERGAVDIIAWHPATRTLLIVEVKSVILDLQALISTLDRKVRLVPKLLAEQRGWVAERVGRLVYAPATTRNRNVVGRHEASLRFAYPMRGADARRWLVHPVGAMAALWLARPSSDRAPAQRVPAPMRVRRSGERRG